MRLSKLTVNLIFVIAFTHCARHDKAPQVDTQFLSACDVTYENFLSTALNKNCVSCHQAGGTAAFSPLDTYASAKGRAEQILKRTSDGTMPPSGAGIQFSVSDIA